MRRVLAILGLAGAAMLVLLRCGARSQLLVGDSDERDDAGPSDAAYPTDVPLPTDVEPLADAGPGILLDCPTVLDDPRLAPLVPGSPIQIDARECARVPAASFRWSVVNQGCDAILPAPRYQLSGTSSPVVTFTPARPGAYEMRLEITTESGEQEWCAFRVWAAGQGLLVELCWDTSTSTDLDLYLHRPDNQDPWFTPSAGAVVPGLNNTTCNSGNCPAELRFELPRASWGYADSPLSYCERGAEWDGFLELGRCPNPRAADDNNQVIATGTAELIQLDYPRPNESFRIMVQNFENAPAAPHVYVYCAGLLQEDIPPPAWPPAFTVPGAIGFGVMWRVADVQPQVDAEGLTTGCEIERLRQPGTDADFVTVNDPSF